MRRPALIAQQAGRPTGLLGRLLLKLMAHETRSFNREVLDVLAPADGERMVEVGFGHGSALAEIAGASPRAELAGIDVSDDAARVAARRCRVALAAGRLDLRVGDGADLPWPDATFDKAFAVHTVYFWSDPLRNLRELRRVLRPGGLLVLGLRERSPAAIASFPPPTYHFYSDDELAAFLRTAGFGEVDVRMARSGAGDLRIVVSLAQSAHS